jgi:protein-L-isoaspartate(D-aspartate) O-methyltransferase
MFGKKPSLEEAQALMVKKQLAARSITDPRILQAMGQIPRHLFVAEEFWDQAYNDSPLPIGHDQTISQPYMVAFMTEALQLPTDGHAVVLEIGTGSGYQAAVLSRLAARVYSIERIESLAAQARHSLDILGIKNVEIKVSDGGYGWPEHAPYDGIIVTAAAPEVPAPLKTQLKEGAMLVVPTGPRRQQQELLRLQWRNGRIIEEKLAPVAFVPLIGEHGWEKDS